MSAIPSPPESITPGIMLSQTFPAVRDTPGASVDILSRALGSYPYGAVHSLDVVDPAERAEFGSIVRERRLWLDLSVSRALGNEKLSLAAGDEAVRRRAVDLVLVLLPVAAEQGARYVSLSSGPGHATEADRPAAIERLSHSLDEILSALERVEADGGPHMGLAVEPQDVARDKRGSLGYLDESVTLVRALAAPSDDSGVGRADGRDVKLICDTAHLRLNDETAAQLFSAAPDLVAALHLCNCCLDPAHELYGDKHIRPGAPGKLDLDDYADVIATAREAVGIRRLPTFIEYRNHGDVDAHLDYLARRWEALGRVDAG